MTFFREKVNQKASKTLIAENAIGPGCRKQLGSLTKNRRKKCASKKGVREIISSLISSKKGKLYLRFIIAVALVLAAVYAYLAQATVFTNGVSL